MRYLLCTAVLAGFLLPTGGRLVTADDKDTAWGTVKGRVVFEGDPPAAKELKIEKDQAHCLAKGKLFSEEWVIGKDKGVRYALVWLAPDGADPLAIHKDLKEIKDKEVSLDQPCCAFEPHVLAIREGQDLVVKNSAPVAHNIRWAGHPLKNTGGSVIIPAMNAHTIKALKAQKLPLVLACDIHPWMKGYLGVFDHPYYAVTDAEGNFEIKNVPAGDCRVVVWQEAIGYRGGAAGKDGEKISIKGGAVTDLGKLGIKP